MRVGVKSDLHGGLLRGHQRRRAVQVSHSRNRTVFQQNPRLDAGGLQWESRPCVLQPLNTLQAAFCI